ncbi:reverse transcriptase domain-containing protein [Pseudorhizobium flavum]|uniref:Reverse transcriptase domain-containing protein n=1 Tax=Pseudorhizobium flavum TaxID=1335061 RepID=A0A7W9YWB2_9HYPH|nr:reverse transcriptase domain-containing protein [Pseudorhizobium flavum]MBB6179437.1 hypothetical protein [Pseudorhizobium flavum]CAD6605593.1 Reverse transcriptase (RNA-dependent DNA polymerase) [Pseudorhizobium flavum]
MPDGVAASTQLSDEWVPREKDLKTYLHFDRNISARRIAEIANDPDSVAKHAFFPLIRFFETWTKFRNGQGRKKKVRPLRYAARVDAAIYARYRALLSRRYEDELVRRDLIEVPVAYRKLPKAGGGNKSNIEIARDVFDEIRNIGNCTVTVVDIKSYFESLDHDRIRQMWEMLLGEVLPPDHESVFDAITRYTVVDYDRLFDRLKMWDKPATGTRRLRRQRRVDALRSAGLKQICSPKEFRDLVAGVGQRGGSLLQKNNFSFGIPQGTPISDLIANFYLIDFDDELHRWASQRGGIYRRYSDDIVVVVPTPSLASNLEVKDYLQARISVYGSRLRIQDQKVSIVQFSSTSGGTNFSHVFGKASRNGLEYLGFEFNGDSVKIKHSTLSNAWRKMKRQAYGHASSYVKRYREKKMPWILANYPASALETQILRDVTFTQDTGYETWTFVKYVRRASSAFVGYNPRFSRQTRRYRRYTKAIINRSLIKALEVHLK